MQTATPSRPRTRARRAFWPEAAAILGSLIASIPLAHALQDPPRAAFAVRNDTAWNLTLYVESGPESVVPVMVIGAERTKNIREVLVPGETWRFIWRFTGDDVGRSSVAHGDLRKPSFVLTVPDEVEQTLLDSGAPPAP